MKKTQKFKKVEATLQMRKFISCLPMRKNIVNVTSGEKRERAGIPTVRKLHCIYAHTSG